MIEHGMCGFTIGRAAYYRQFPAVEVRVKDIKRFRELFVEYRQTG